MSCKFVEFSQIFSIPSDCGDPQAPLSGTVVSNNFTHVTFQCDDGYQMLGNSVVACQETEIWEESPICRPGELTMQILSVNYNSHDDILQHEFYLFSVPNHNHKLVGLTPRLIKI